MGRSGEDEITLSSRKIYTWKDLNLERAVLGQSLNKLWQPSDKSKSEGAIGLGQRLKTKGW